MITLHPFIFAALMVAAFACGVIVTLCLDLALNKRSHS
jgi:hypothetical protein